MKFSEKTVAIFNDQMREFASRYGFYVRCETDTCKGTTDVSFSQPLIGNGTRCTVLWKEVNSVTDIASKIMNRIIDKYRLTRPSCTYDIKKVIFNDPCTIVLWADGTKTVVKTQNNEVYDAEKGLAMCISKKALGNKGDYYEVFKKHTDKHPYVGMKPEEYTKAEIAYNRLVNALRDSKARKVDLTIAMQEAVGYLGEVLDI